MLIETPQTTCFQASRISFPSPAKQKLILFSVRREGIQLCCDAMANRQQLTKINQYFKVQEKGAR
jgi:hypothetical protein